MAAELPGLAFPIHPEPKLSNANRFRTLVEPWDLHFNSAHFITFGEFCENLHGHNFHARVTVSGSNGADGYVIDFTLLNRLAADVCRTLHDRVILPGTSRVVHIAPEGEMLRIESFGKVFVLPQQNCIILPVTNVTAEMLAWHISEELVKGLAANVALDTIDEIEVAVEEADRQWGIFRREIR